MNADIAGANICPTKRNIWDYPQQNPKLKNKHKQVSIPAKTSLLNKNNH